MAVIIFGPTQKTNTSIHSFSRTNSTTNILCPGKKKKKVRDSFSSNRASCLSVMDKLETLTF